MENHYSGVFPHVNPFWQTAWSMPTCISETSSVYQHPSGPSNQQIPNVPTLRSPRVWPPTEALVILPPPPTEAEAKAAKKAAKAAARAAEQAAVMQT